MKLYEINQKTLENLNNSSLSSLHFRIHQLWACRNKKRMDLDTLKKVHELIKDEMIKRNLKHSPSFLKHNLKNLFVYNEDLD